MIHLLIPFREPLVTVDMCRRSSWGFTVNAAGQRSLIEKPPMFLDYMLGKGGKPSMGDRHSRRMAKAREKAFPNRWRRSQAVGRSPRNAQTLETTGCE